jgi:hypothetical protein
MGNTYKHKLIGKFKNNIDDYNDLDINIKKMFSRKNWDIGEGRKDKKNKIDKISNKQFKKDYNDDEN